MGRKKIFFCVENGKNWNDIQREGSELRIGKSRIW